jgi:hypothetical protein
LANFEDWFPKQAANVRTCSELSKDDKSLFFNELDGVGHAAASDAERHARAYFHAHKFLGGTVSLRSSRERLGRLHEWTAVEWLASRASVPRDKLDSYRDSVRVGDMSIVDELLDLLGAQPMPPVVWCFRDSAADSPFRAVDAATLPCRLALDKLAKDDYLPLEIQMPSSAVARKSTAFDAAFQQHWCPGGTSCPRTECRDQNGLPEVVVAGRTATVPTGLTFADARPALKW